MKCKYCDKLLQIEEDIFNSYVAFFDDDNMLINMIRLVEYWYEKKLWFQFCDAQETYERLIDSYDYFHRHSVFCSFECSDSCVIK